MSKDLVIRTGSYTDKEGNEKGEYTKLGVILSNDNGEYALIDPSVSLAGCLMKQRVMNQEAGKKMKGDMIMCGVYDRDNQQSNNQGGQSNSANNDFDDDLDF